MFYGKCSVEKIPSPWIMGYQLFTLQQVWQVFLISCTLFWTLSIRGDDDISLPMLQVVTKKPPLIGWLFKVIAVASWLVDAFSPTHVKTMQKSKILLMEEILHQLRFVVYPIIYRVLYIPGGARFLPSRVAFHFQSFQQPYSNQKSWKH